MAADKRTHDVDERLGTYLLVKWPDVELDTKAGIAELPDVSPNTLAPSTHVLDLGHDYTILRSVSHNYLPWYVLVDRAGCFGMGIADLTGQQWHPRNVVESKAKMERSREFASEV